MVRLYSCLVYIFCLILIISASAFAATTPITIGTGVRSGIYYDFGKVIGQFIFADSKGALNIIIQNSYGSGENVYLTQNGLIDIAFTQNDIAHYAYHGVEPYKNVSSNVRALARLYPEYIHVVARKDSGIKTVKDFKGKRVSVGVYGSGSEINSRLVLRYHGLNYDNIEPLFLSYGKTIDKFKSGDIDAFVFTLGTNNKAMQKITDPTITLFIPLDEAKTGNFVTKFPYFTKDTIPAGTYEGQDKPIPTLSVQAILIVNKNMPEDLVYAFTSSIFENIDEIAMLHPKGSEIFLEKALDGITIPFHSGAERYFKEKGILKD